MKIWECCWQLVWQVHGSVITNTTIYSSGIESILHNIHTSTNRDQIQLSSINAMHPAYTPQPFVTSFLQEYSSSFSKQHKWSWHNDWQGDLLLLRRFDEPWHAAVICSASSSRSCWCAEKSSNKDWSPLLLGSFLPFILPISTTKTIQVARPTTTRPNIITAGNQDDKLILSFTDSLPSPFSPRPLLKLTTSNRGGCFRCLLGA